LCQETTLPTKGSYHESLLPEVKKPAQPFMEHYRNRRNLANGKLINKEEDGRAKKKKNLTTYRIKDERSQFQKNNVKKIKEIHDQLLE